MSNTIGRDTSAINVSEVKQTVQEFNTKYLGFYATDPTTDQYGNPITQGAFYYNTTSSNFFYWTGSAWDDFAFSSDAIAKPNTSVVGNSLVVDSTGGKYVLASPYYQSAWINSNFKINQRGATTVADGAYGPDRCFVLSELGSIGFTSTAFPGTGISAGRFTQSSATAQRFGVGQIIDSQDVSKFRYKKFTLNAKARISTGSVTVRAALLSPITALVDAMPKDVVNNWASTNYTSGNFFISDVNVLGISSTVVPSGQLVDISVSADIPGGTYNLMMFIWIEGTVAQNTSLWLGSINAGSGETLPTYSEPDPSQELIRCQRYYWSSYPLGVAAGTPSQSSYLTTFFESTSSWGGCTITFPTPMRVVPSTATYSPSTGASGKYYNGNQTMDYASYTSAISHRGLTVAAQGNGAVGTGGTFHVVADAEVGT